MKTMAKTIIKRDRYTYREKTNVRQPTHFLNTKPKLKKNGKWQWAMQRKKTYTESVTQISQEILLQTLSVGTTVLITMFGLQQMIKLVHLSSA